MTKKFAKNSKKGLTLPMAIVISIVLVIVAAGLIFIALSSISTTDVSVNGRQSFMDVRSALDYAESYYRTQVTNYSKIGKQVVDSSTGKKWREEYIVAEEDEVVVGTAGKRTTVKYAVQDTMPDTEVVKTYVIAQYFAAVGKTSPKLKLTGYSHYSDTFGNSGKMVSLSVTFTVGSSGSQKRVTVINTWKEPNTKSASDTITLHLKKPADLDWPGICYYIWTYNDVAGAYKNDEGKNVKYSYYDNDGNKFTPDLNKTNINEKTESVKPNSAWNSDSNSPMKGPNGVMVTQGNGWAVGDYQINSNRVNYFNVIFANQGTLLNENGIFDSQLNEIFHLWYLNENDKNIYFEFLNKRKYDPDANTNYYTRFRTGRDWKSKDKLVVDPNDEKDTWDGLQGLDDTILVYLRNQKTTVHFRSWQDSNTMNTTGVAAPVIESVSISDGTPFKGPTFLTNDGKKMDELTASDKNKECSGSKINANIKMTYEGCGWWVANIETKKPFNITINYKGMAGSLSLTNVRPHTDSSAPESVPESWIVFKSNGKLESHQTEATALRALGVDNGSYVTIHAKNYDADMFASPVLNYMNVIEESSTGRQKLYEKILEMNMLDPLDYANYEELFGDVGGTTGLKNKAISVYNAGADFMRAPYKVDEAPKTPVAGAAINITAADNAYETYVTRIDERITQLKPSVADPQTINAFISIYDEAKTIYENLIDYDEGYHSNFESEYKKTFTDKAYDNYEQLYTLVQKQDNVTITKNELSDAVTSLTNVVDQRITAEGVTIYGIKHQKLVRTSLETLVNKIDKGNYKDKTIYQEEYIDKMITELSVARTIIEKEGSKYKNNTTKSDIESAYTKLNDALEVLKTKTIPKNTLDFTERDAKIESANQLIQNAEAAGENYTDKSKAALQAAITASNALTDSTTATQDDVTAAVNEIKKCIDRFTVFKPQNINDALKADGKMRIWLENQEGCVYKVYAKGLTGDFEELVGRIKTETGTELSYIDLVKASEIEFRVTAEIDGNPAITAEDVVVADMTDETVIYTVDREAGTITAKDLVTVFLGKKDADKKTINMTDFSTTGTNPTTGYGTETDYYFVRFAVEKGKSFNETLSITQTDTSTNVTSTTGVSGENRIITAPGEYVVIWTDDGAWRGYKACKVSDIYPKTLPENTGDNPPAEEPTVSRTLPSDDRYEIVPLATDLNWGAEFESIAASASMGANDICILFDTQNWSEFSGGKKPYIYVWKGGGGSGKQNADYKSKPAMTHYKDTYYYYVCDKSYENIIISNGSGDDGGSVKKVVDTAKIPSGYKYYVLRANSLGGNGNMVWKSKTAGATTVGDNTLYDLIDISVGYGKTCIFFDTQGSGKVPYIHYWGGTDATKWGTLTQMMKFQNYNNYYYVVINDTNKGFIISYSSSGDPKVVANNGDLEINTATGQRYKYYIVRAGTGDDYIVDKHDSAPSVVVDEPEEVDAESFVSGLKMAYVGGGRIRVKNKSYIETYPSGSKWNSMAGSSKVKIEESTSLDLSGSPVCIIASRNSKDNPRVYIWREGGDKYKDWDHRKYMTYLGASGGKHYYYIVFDGYYDHFIVTQGVQQSGDFAMNGSAVYIVNSVNVTSSSIETSGSVTSVSMPSGLSLPDMSSFDVHDNSSTSYIEQKVLDTLTGGRDRDALSNSWKFGGYGSNHASDNRVGDSKLLPYYDWYEYKIPVNQSNVYTFEVWGLDPNTSYNKTPQIKKVYGDVWVSLYNDEGQSASGRALDGSTQNIKTFSHTELSTFDPEKTMTTEKVSVYFRMPAGDSTHKWQNVRVVKAHGTGDSTASNIQQNIEMTPVFGLTDGRNTNIWKASGISKNNPFLELAVDEVDTTSGTPIIKPHTYRIKLQGGHKKLFNPIKGLDGAWEKYQSDYEYLEDVCSSLLNMYYAKTIVNQYNSVGEIVNQASETDTQKNSGYLLELIGKDDSVYKSYFKKSGVENGGTYKVAINQSAIEASDSAADAAYSNYKNLKDIVEVYTKLYNKMNEAKAYMNIPLSTDYNGNDYHKHAAGASQYPEFVNRGNYKIYNQDDVSALAAKLSGAEVAYITGSYDGSSGVDAAQKAIEALDRAIANIRVGVEGTIAVVLYDAQSKTGNGYSFTVSYKDNNGVEHINEPVDQINIEGYPIKFIYNEATEQPYEYIEDVQFSNTYTDKTTGVVHMNENIGPSQKKIEKNEVYVLMDYAKVDDEEAAFWRKNALTDYRQMDSDLYVKNEDADDVVLQMKKTEDGTEFETMTVYFRYDTTVKYGSTTYTIKAGAYDFNNGDTTEPTSVAYEGKLRLFDDRAKAYFEKSENYGMYTPGLSAVSIGWTTGSKFASKNLVSTNGNVNLDVSQGAFTALPGTRSYSYSTNGGIYFRWSSESALEVGGGGVELHASEIRFGAVGEINVPSQYGSENTHFKFYNFSGEDNMVVHFLTDITVKYLDSTSATHSFVIREGKYSIRKDPDAGTDYIADLFDETYWKTGVYVKPLSDGEDASVFGSGSSGLSDKATYSN